MCAEFVKLSGHLKLDHWLFPFLIDYAIYKGRYDDALSRLLQITEPYMDTVKNLKMANVYFLKKNYRVNIKISVVERRNIYFFLCRCAWTTFFT